MLEFTKNLALSCGAIMLQEQSKLKQDQIHAKGTVKDLCTDIDRMVEDYIIRAIGREYPHHSVWGEENGKNLTGDDYLWVIDPIDGTNSYIHNFPYFCVSIALFYRNEAQLGVLYAPALKELFYAQKGKGAYLNGERLHVSGCRELNQALLSTGFACLRANLPENNLAICNRVLPQIIDVRRTGSAALDLAYVGAGRFDGFWELALNLYDVAAGVLIAQESGGKCTDFYLGTEYPQKGIICTNTLLHEKLQSLIVPCNRDEDI